MPTWCAGASTTTSTSPVSSCCSCSPPTTTSGSRWPSTTGTSRAITSSDFLVTYTCDVRPSADEQQAIRAWVEGGGRWLALHGTNCALDPPAGQEGGLYTAPRAFPVWADTLGSQFLSHPPIAPYPVSRSPGADDDPLVAGIEPFESDDELYLMEHHGDVVPLLETRWTGTTRGFAEADWLEDEPRLVLYRRPLGGGRGRVLHARPLPEPLGHDPPAARRRSLAERSTAARGTSRSSWRSSAGRSAGPKDATAIGRPPGAERRVSRRRRRAASCGCDVGPATGVCATRPRPARWR